MYRRFDTATDSSKIMPIAGQSQLGRNTGAFVTQAQGNINRQGSNAQQGNQRGNSQINQRDVNNVGNVQSATPGRQGGGKPQGGQTQAKHHQGALQASNGRADRPEENINHAESLGRAVQNQNTGKGSPTGHRGQQPQNDGCGKAKQSQGKAKINFLKGLLPSSVYDPKSKKIFGILSAEDLLLVALIFLFLEKDDGDNTIMVLALVYVLISDYIDLPDFVL